MLSAILSNCGLETETTEKIFLCCPFFTVNRKILLYGLFKIDLSLINLKDHLLLDILLYDSDKYKGTVSKEILLHTVSFIKNTKCFERPLFDH